MRLPNNSKRWGISLSLVFALAGCGLLGSGDSPQLASTLPAAPPMADSSGPEADYPVEIGPPYKIDGIEYTPSNAWNYDAVGYATAHEGVGASAAHKTLPLPSYVEVTSLESGKTILVRVEERGPMSNAREIGLSATAQSQLGAGEGTPVRVRRVNPPENEKFALRSGGPPPTRVATPTSLVEVLRRKLPASGSASLANASAQPAVPPSDAATRTTGRQPTPTRRVLAQPSPMPTSTPSPAATPARAEASDAAATSEQPADRGRFVVQAAAFSKRANADRAARAIGGFVQTAGGYHRVRTGPYTSRGQAEAALAMVRAAGYSDAQVFTAG